MTEKQKHPSYGMMRFSRIQSSYAVPFFGTRLLHRNWIELTISEGESGRDLSRDWHMDGKQLIRVRLTEAQFATLITTLNYGSGSPCTIQRYNGEMVPDPPEQENLIDLTKFEHSERMKATSRRVRDIINQMKNAIIGTVKKGDIKEIISKLEILMHDLGPNLKFEREQFDKHMAETVSEAKADIEAHVAASIAQTGIQALANQVPVMKELKGATEDED